MTVMTIDVNHAYRHLVFHETGSSIDKSRALLELNLTCTKKKHTCHNAQLKFALKSFDGITTTKNSSRKNILDHKSHRSDGN